jgi:hypothetical protein
MEHQYEVRVREVNCLYNAGFTEIKSMYSILVNGSSRVHSGRMGKHGADR